MNLANSYETLAEVLKREGKFPEALVYCRRSRFAHGGSAKPDRTDNEIQFTLADSAVLLIDLLVAAGQESEARARPPGLSRPSSAGRRREALASPARSLPEDPFEYALPGPCQKRSGPPLALHAVEITHGKEAESLQLLAKAYQDCGDTPKALDAVRKALTLLPAVPQGKPTPELRGQLEALQSQLSSGQRQGQ